VVGLAPRALEKIVRPRRFAGVFTLPLNFTVRQHASLSCHILGGTAFQFSYSGLRLWLKSPIGP
jgi:hypothetical protein